MEKFFNFELEQIGHFDLISIFNHLFFDGVNIKMP